MNTGIPELLQGFINGIIAQESRSLALNTLCVRNLHVVNSFQKWFDVRLILDFCVSLHPHFMMHFWEQKTPYYFFCFYNWTIALLSPSRSVCLAHLSLVTMDLYWFLSYLTNALCIGGLIGDSVMYSFVFSRMQIHNGMEMFEERKNNWKDLLFIFILFKKQIKNHQVSSASSSLS